MMLTHDDEEREDPVCLSPGQLVSSSKLGKNLGAYLDQVRRRPLFIMREQQVEAVLVSIDRYRALLEEERQAEEVYMSILAVRRLLELHLTGRKTVGIDDVLARYGITTTDVEEERGVDGEDEVGG